jgi:hypothetical protein
MKKIFTAYDARREKHLADARLFAKKGKTTTKFEVVDSNGGKVINPTTKARAEQYVSELDLLCPTFAPHAIRAVTINW